MSMIYRGYFSFYVFNNDELSVNRLDVPINSFEVIGGTVRRININSTDDISISSELEQARSYKNINLFLPPTKDSTDMETALSLTDIALSDFNFGVMVAIQRCANGKLLEGLTLIDRGAKLKNRPRIVGQHLLKVELDIPSPKLFYGVIQGHIFKSTKQEI